MEVQSSLSQHTSTMHHQAPTGSTHSMSQDRKVLIEELNSESETDFEENKNDGTLDFQVNLDNESSSSHRRKSRKAEIIDGVVGDDEEDEEEGGGGDDEVVTCALGILSGILSLGKSSRGVKIEESLRTLLWPLQIISYRESNREIAKGAADAALLILTRSHTNKLNKLNKISRVDEVTMTGVINDKDDMHSAFANMLLTTLQDYCDSPEPHMRALGIHIISTAIDDVTQVSACYFT